jgi:hypothetical protein
MIMTFSSIGLPGTNGFVGEFLAILGAFESELRWYAIIATTGVIFAAVYMLWMYQRVMFGELKNPKNAELKDLSAREITLMVPLLVFVFWIGVYPNTFFDKMNPALENLIKQVKSQQVAMVVPASTDGHSLGNPRLTHPGMPPQGHQYHLLIWNISTPEELYHGKSGPTRHPEREFRCDTPLARPLFFRHGSTADECFHAPWQIDPGGVVQPRCCHCHSFCFHRCLE